MRVMIRSKHFQLGDSLHGHIKKMCEAVAKKYHLDPVQFHAVLDHKDDSHQFSAVFSFHLGAHILKAEETGADAYKTVDQAIHKLEELIRREKKRITDHHRHHDNHHFVDKKAMALDDRLSKEKVK